MLDKRPRSVLDVVRVNSRLTSFVIGALGQEQVVVELALTGATVTTKQSHAVAGPVGILVPVFGEPRSQIFVAIVNLKRGQLRARYL